MSPYWLSALAEEVAGLAASRNLPALSARLRSEAALRSLTVRDLVARITAEWARQGIVTVPTAGILRGWVDTKG